MIKKIFVCVLMITIATASWCQVPKKKVATTEGALYFSLTDERNGKRIFITKESGRTIDKDSLKMANQIAAYYKAGQKISNVKDITYDSYFLSSITEEPTILYDQHGLPFDNSIWVSCLDSLVKNDQVVFQVREITLEDGTKIQNPKLAKVNKAVYKLFSNPNFPQGGWKAKANHWIDLWKQWFKLSDANFYTLDDKVLQLYAEGIVYTIKEKPGSKKR